VTISNTTLLLLSSIYDNNIYYDTTDQNTNTLLLSRKHIDGSVATVNSKIARGNQHSISVKVGGGAIKIQIHKTIGYVL
jgi:hypothetical protein